MSWWISELTSSTRASMRRVLSRDCRGRKRDGAINWESRANAEIPSVTRIIRNTAENNTGLNAEKVTQKTTNTLQYMHEIYSHEISLIIQSSSNHRINYLISTVCLPTFYTFADPFKPSAKHSFIPNLHFTPSSFVILSSPAPFAPSVAPSIQPSPPSLIPPFRSLPQSLLALHYVLMNFSWGHLSCSIIPLHRIICSSWTPLNSLKRPKFFLPTSHSPHPPKKSSTLDERHLENKLLKQGRVTLKQPWLSA